MCMCAYMYADIACTYIHSRMHACICTYVLTFMPSLVRPPHSWMDNAANRKAGHATIWISARYVRVCVCIHRYTYTQTHTQRHTHTHTQRHTHTHTHARARARMLTEFPNHLHAWLTHTRSNTLTGTRSHIRLQTNIRIHVRSYIHANTQTNRVSSKISSPRDRRRTSLSAASNWYACMSVHVCMCVMFSIYVHVPFCRSVYSTYDRMIEFCTCRRVSSFLSVCMHVRM